MTYTIKVTEVYSGFVEVDADSEDEAIQAAMKEHFYGNFKMYCEDNIYDCVGRKDN